jgi:hypothetical protein
VHNISKYFYQVKWFETEWSNIWPGECEQTWKISPTNKLLDSYNIIIQFQPRPVFSQTLWLYLQLHFLPHTKKGASSNESPLTSTMTAIQQSKHNAVVDKHSAHHQLWFCLAAKQEEYLALESIVSIRNELNTRQWGKLAKSTYWLCGNHTNVTSSNQYPLLARDSIKVHGVPNVSTIQLIYKRVQSDLNGVRDEWLQMQWNQNITTKYPHVISLNPHPWFSAILNHWITSDWKHL